jgi:hypothetical protein
MVQRVRVIVAVFAVVCATAAGARNAVRTPILTRSPSFNLSRFAAIPKEGVDWRMRKDGMPTEARFANHLGSFAIAAQSRNSDFAGLTRGLAIEGDLAALDEDQSYGRLELSAQTNPASLASLALRNSAAVAADLERRLMRIGADRLVRDESLGAHSGRDRRVESSSVASGEGAAPAVDTAWTHRDNLAASVSQSAVSLTRRRPIAFDASEGTPLDPLLNTTYDLNFAKTVPPLKADLLYRQVKGAD